MKHITQLTLTVFSVSFFLGCSTHLGDTPSQNSAINTISPTNSSKKDGVMQKSLDGWLKKDWTPTVQKDEKIKSKYMEPKKVVTKKDSKEKVKYVEKRNSKFTLQEYVDKAGAYMRAKPNDYNSSHVHKMESMPVIGK